MNTDRVISELKTKLVPYLDSHGIDLKKGNVECIFKDRHKKGTDTHPSMGLLSRKDATHCFTCGAVADIFQWAYFLEGLPIGRTGEFYTVTLPKLAKQLLNIDYVPETLSEEDRTKYMARRAYAMTIGYTSANVGLFAKYIKERGWSDATIRRYDIGGVPSFNEYVSFMNRAGYTRDILSEIGLYDSDLFNEDRLIIPIYDSNGNVVRITGRTISGTSPKYINTKTNILNQNIPKLYGLNHVQGKEAVYIVEGFSDVVTMFEYGYDNAVAVLGCSINIEQANEIRKAGARNIAIMLDGDQAWKEQLPGNIVDIMKAVPMNITVVQIPEALDPDEYLHKHKDLSGVNAMSPLTFLMNVEENQPLLKEHKIDKFTDVIALTSSVIAREKMIKELAGISELDVTLIRREVMEKRTALDQLQYKEEQELKKEVIRMSKNTETSLSDISFFIQRQLESKKKSIAVDPLMLAQDIATDARLITDYSSDQPAINLGELKRFQDDTDGLSLHANLLLLSGMPHVGKSSFLRFMLAQMALNNPDVSVIYFSIEDGKEKAIPSFLSIFNNYPTNLNRNVAKMRRVYQEQGVDAYMKAWATYNELVRDKRLLVYDRTIGTSIEEIDYVVSALRESGTRKMFVAIDSLNSLVEKNINMAPNEALVYRTTKLKDMIEKYDIPILTVAELRKTNAQTTRQINLDDITYTFTLPYRADVVLFIGAEGQTLEDAPTAPYLDPITHQTRSYPIINLVIRKNKINGYTGQYDLCFIKDRSRFAELSK